MKHLVWLVAAGLVISSPALAGKKKKKSKEPVKVEGWQKGEADAFSCWHPKDYASLGPGDRKMARMASLNAMVSQWRGERRDGIRFQEETVEHLETVLLGESSKIEAVSVDNLAQCLNARKDGATISWGNWLTDTPSRITEGECKWPPLDYQLFDYLSIGNEWQIPAKVCKGNRIEVKGSVDDEYRISEDGPWINVTGDREQPAGGTLPCNIEGCYKGQLVMRFTTEAGVVTVMPVNESLTWEAPEHGTIEVMINDDTWFDNEFRVVQGIQHHTQITYQPVGGVK